MAGVAPATASATAASNKQQQRIELRALNLADRPPSTATLDASLKRNTAFIKRLRSSIHTTDSELLLKETEALSLDKYLSELVSAVAEGITRCKTTQEIWNAVLVISKLSRRFNAAFTTPLTSSLLTSLSPPSKATLHALQPEQREKEENVRVIRQRSLLRLLAELEAVAVVKGPQGASDGSETYSVLKQLLFGDKEFLTVSIPLAVSFCKNLGWLYLPPTGTSSGTSAQDEEAATIIPAEQQAKFHALIKQYYDQLCQRAIKDRLHLLETDRKNEEAYVRSGEIFEDRAQAYEKLVKHWEKEWNGCTLLAECLGLVLPELPTLPKDPLVVGTGTLLVAPPPVSSGDDVGHPTSLWADEEEKAFYRDLLDLQDEVPPSILGASKIVPELELESAATSGQKNEQDPEAESAEPVDNEDVDGDGNQARDALEAEQEALPPAPAARLSDLFARLPEMNSRTFIDKAAVEFAHLNSKAARNRLIKFMASVSPARTDLLPFYARMLATLNPYMPDVSKGVLAVLDGDVRYLRKRKNLEMRDVRPKTLRFISELAKFDLAPPHSILHTFKVFIDELSGYNVDSVCILLENCGRYVLRHDSTREKMTALLETLLRKKAAQNLDARQVSMLDSAYYQCNPPDRPAIARRERSSMHQFIHHLMYNILTRQNYDKAYKLARTLHWEDPEVWHSLHNCFTKIWKLKFGNIPLVALLLYDLGKFHPDFAVSVIDTVLENVITGLEKNDFRQNQPRIATIKYLGELYNFQSVDAKIILNCLWQLVTFADGRPMPNVISPIDAPDDWFRVRLICTLLDATGTYLDTGSNKAKLDNYLTFFQLYINTKATPPMDVEYMLLETLERLRPKLVLSKSFEEAAAAVEAMIVANATTAAVPEPEEEQPPERDPHLVPDSDSDNDGGSETDSDGPEGSQGSPPDQDDDDNVLPLDVGKRPGLTEEEEDQFSRELAKLMSGTSVKQQRTALVLPTVRKDKSAEQRASDERHMVFTMLTRKGAKTQMHAMEIPVDSSIATHTRQQQEQEKLEQQQLKELVLQSERRQKNEADAAEQRSMQANFAKQGFRIKTANTKNNHAP